MKNSILNSQLKDLEKLMRDSGKESIVDLQNELTDLRRKN